MKYIKSISLFFVYPMCCFIMGIFTARRIPSKEEAEIVMETEISVSEEVLQESVMNNHALLEIITEGDESDQESKEEGYFIILQDGYVTVFTTDRVTIYMTTGIDADALPEEVEANLRNGMYISDEGKLYDFLESYTS